MQLLVKNRGINGSPITIPMSLYFLVARFYHHAVKNPAKPRKVSRPIVPITKRVTPKATNSSVVIFPSLIRGANIGTYFYSHLTDIRPKPTLLLKLNFTIRATFLFSAGCVGI